MKPPFEIYRGCDIADADGHVCTAENPEIANRLVAILNAFFALRDRDDRNSSLHQNYRDIIDRALTSTDAAP